MTARTALAPPKSTSYWNLSPSERVRQARHWLGLDDDTDLFIRQVQVRQLSSGYKGGPQHTYAVFAHQPDRGWAAAFVCGLHTIRQTWWIGLADGQWTPYHPDRPVVLDFHPTLLDLLGAATDAGSSVPALQVADIAGLLTFGDALLPLAARPATTAPATDANEDEAVDAALPYGADAPHQVALCLFALAHPQQVTEAAPFARQPIATPLTVLDTWSELPVT